MDKLTKYNLNVAKLLIAGFLTACVLAIVGVVVLVGALCWVDYSGRQEVIRRQAWYRENRPAAGSVTERFGLEVVPPWEQRRWLQENPPEEVSPGIWLQPAPPRSTPAARSTP